MGQSSMPLVVGEGETRSWMVVEAVVSKSLKEAAEGLLRSLMAVEEVVPR